MYDKFIIQDILMDIQLEIKKDEKRYADAIKNNRDKKIVIYGAGRMAKNLYKYLKKNNIMIDLFCVTDKSINKSEEYGVSIVQIDEMDVDKDSLILLGVNPRWNEEVVKTLEDNGYTNYVVSTEYIRYHGDFHYDLYMSPMLEITTKIGCSVNCKYCPQSILLKNYFLDSNAEKEMSMETFKKCVDKVPDNTWIHFAGFVEPFLNKNCLSMLEYAKAKGRKINLYTTLVGVKKYMIDTITSINYGEFVLHLPDIKGYANIPINEEYLEILDVLLDKKKDNGEPLVDYATSQAEVPETIQKVINRRTNIFCALNDRAGNLESTDSKKLCSYHNIDGIIECDNSYTINHNILLPDGRIVLCCMDYSMKHILGNLLEQDYEDIINGKELQKIKYCMNDLSDKSILCRNCNYARKL